LTGKVMLMKMKMLKKM